MEYLTEAIKPYLIDANIQKIALAYVGMMLAIVTGVAVKKGKDFSMWGFGKTWRGVKRGARWAVTKFRKPPKAPPVIGPVAQEFIRVMRDASNKAIKNDSVLTFDGCEVAMATVGPDGKIHEARFKVANECLTYLSADDKDAICDAAQAEINKILTDRALAKQRDVLMLLRGKADPIESVSAKLARELRGGTADSPIDHELHRELRKHAASS